MLYNNYSSAPHLYIITVLYNSSFPTHRPYRLLISCPSKSKNPSAILDSKFWGSLYSMMLSCGKCDSIMIFKAIFKFATQIHMIISLLKQWKQIEGILYSVNSTAHAHLYSKFQPHLCTQSCCVPLMLIKWNVAPPRSDWSSYFCAFLLPRCLLTNKNGAC